MKKSVFLLLPSKAVGHEHLQSFVTVLYCRHGVRLPSVTKTKKATKTTKTGISVACFLMFTIKFTQDDQLFHMSYLVSPHMAFRV